MATPSDLLFALAWAHTLVRNHPRGAPELLEALEDVRDAQGAVGWTVVRVQPDGLWVSGHHHPDTSDALEQFRKALLAAGIQEIRLQDVMEPEVIEDFLRRIHDGEGNREPPAPRFRGLESDLGLSFSRARDDLPGMPGSIQALFGPRAQPTAVLAATEPEPDRRPPTAVAEPGTPARALDPGLEERARAFLGAPPGERAEMRAELLAAARARTGVRELPAQTDLVELLVESGGKDPEVLEVARALTTSGVASHLVARLGTSRDEEERARRVAVTSILGEEMARALADALGEARDRFQRRAYMDALAAHGPVAVEVAAGMVEDPRWFVVRNGVALLGELGGEQAVSHVTGTLANTDARVRREGVLALARLGGDDAGLLLLGMLDDGDADVRAMACRALGALKVDKAFRPLLRLLEEDPHEEVQVEGLHALGQIGDPGAVPFIEKRALGGLFYRPSREVRIAAYRALAAIGTPHALGLLEKATRDSDTGVRTVAQALLEEGRG